MKKLMIAALVATMGGAVMAADCYELGCPFIYRLKLAGKTVVGYATASNKVTCTDGACWQKPASLRIAGYFFGQTTGGDCGEACACFTPTKEASIFWDGNHRKVEFTDISFGIGDSPIGVCEVLRNSGAMNKAQMLIKMDDLVLAGFAAYNPKTGNIKNANGFFAGTLPVKGCSGAGTCGEPGVTDADVYVFVPCRTANPILDPAATDSSVVVSQGSIAYGRWNLAYKADKVAQAKKIAKSVGCPWAVEGLIYPSDIKGLTEDDLAALAAFCTAE